MTVTCQHEHAVAICHPAVHGSCWCNDGRAEVLGVWVCAEEYIDGELTGNLGEVLIRCAPFHPHSQVSPFGLLPGVGHPALLPSAAAQCVCCSSVDWRHDIKLSSVPVTGLCQSCAPLIAHADPNGFV